ncbi:H(+)-transporting V1 sector ATPase subunit H [Puccinia graminis f. sp. tritici]|uniref:V-type proton ATPase subunit H n=2 Tax=Puccinia graminis f. sp. tritici TaxID=56615 RepID=A0A5B0NW59_PUCGR|nr:H(+)-transporting V1 sector ATPase subunit H [Puccinia graminis f. sp. tritici]KAA1115770.1 H(+)-transporting V1 sector ATPase subunit H [Puccinia graminis f. sp. tritici]
MRIRRDAYTEVELMTNDEVQPKIDFHPTSLLTINLTHQPSKLIMSKFFNAWLQDQDCRTRIREIPWEGYHRASLISADDLALLQATASQPKLKQEQIWEHDTEKYVSLYLNLLSQLSRVDCLQATLVYLSDMIEDHEDRIALLLDHAVNPYAALTPHLESPDYYIRIKALSLLSVLLEFHPTPPQDVLSTIGPMIARLTGSGDSNEQELGIELFEHVLRQPLARQAVWASAEESGASSNGETTQSNVISSLVQMMKSASRMTAQIQYQLAFCFWLLTFDVAIASQFNKRFSVIPLLTELARSAVKEKVIRILVATFRNLAEKAPEANLATMLVAGNLLPLIQNFSSRKWSDDELKDDIEWLKEQLEEAKRKMTTYDEYLTELESGLLRWSPPHTSEEFWSQNADKLNEKNHQPLKKVIELLSSASDPVVLAVAANDLSQYVKHSDVGKRSAERLGAKPVVMKLMTHQDSDVKYWALVSVQQLVSQPWSY